MDTKTRQIFEELFKTEENKRCFDCGDSADEWASVNNGIFLCGKCAVAHKKYGINVSSVRNINTDPWSDIHLALMANGGNARLREFFDQYFIPKDGPKDFKYRTKAGFHYRKELRAITEGTFVPGPLDAEEALELDTFSDPNEVPEYEQGFKATAPREEKGLDKMYSYLEKTFDKTVNKTKDTASALGEKLKDPNLVGDMGRGMKEMGTSFVQETKNVANAITEKLTDPNLKQNLVAVGDKINSGVKTGWFSAVGLFQKWTGLAPQVEENQVHVQEDKYDTVFTVEQTESVPTEEKKTETIPPQEEEKKEPVATEEKNTEKKPEEEIPTL